MSNEIERNPNCNRGYYSDGEIAKLLGVSLGRLRNKLWAGDPLPPRIEPPGSRHRLWPYDAVHNWLMQFTVTADGQTRISGESAHRGRPTKREQRLRRGS